MNTMLNSVQSMLHRTRPGGETGRRTGLKIPSSERNVPGSIPVPGTSQPYFFYKSTFRNSGGANRVAAAAFHSHVPSVYCSSLDAGRALVLQSSAHDRRTRD